MMKEIGMDRRIEVTMSRDAWIGVEDVEFVVNHLRKATCCLMTDRAIVFDFE